MNKIILIIIILIFTGCNKKKNELIYDTIGKKIEMTDIKNDSNQFTILRYIDNPLCTSCQLKLGEWKIYNKRLKKRFNNKVGLYFLCETKNIE